jgi:hypothetical protein
VIRFRFIKIRYGFTSTIGLAKTLLAVSSLILSSIFFSAAFIKKQCYGKKSHDQDPADWVLWDPAKTQ